ncbi:thioesterase-like superfamily-domain-containing protein [Xylariomycetidae sp. FL0641]|nr:thioesterase-like superfamily-domain-containing protein [Xylariomycetidae sp. FL0641]
MEGREVAWGEMDSFGHVNNAHYLRYAETSRVNWILHFAELDRANRQAWRDMMTTRGTGVIMRGILAQYSYPLTYPDKISVYHRLHRVPDPQSQKTSFSLDCVILSHQHRRVAATTVEDVVVYDYPNRRRAALPAFALDMFRETFRLQEEQQQRSLARIADLMKEVESLEKETWDRKDAKEDLGGAKAG